MGSIDQSKMENGPKELGRQIDWLEWCHDKQFWMDQRLSITSIKRLRWALTNPRNWADK